MESSSETSVCEYCKKAGPKESFYSNSKRFCSAACSHTFSAQHRFKKAGKPIVEKPIVSVAQSNRFILPSETERHQCISMGFDWGSYLVSKKAEAASVELFQHAPMAAHWGEIGNGMKIEVLNLDCNLNTKVYWIASVVQVAGYKAKLRYEGFGDDGANDFWCNLCTLDVHAVGWCATIGKPLVPPQTIQHKYNNWKSFLVKRLTGAKTLPNDFQKRVVDSVNSLFLTNMRLEVVDKTKISRMRVGIVEEIVGGRLRLRYEDSEYENDDFWCHSQSPIIHSIGWCEKVGHKILVASKDYKTKKGFKNARQELFSPVKMVKSCGFKVGMKLEAIDPLNLSAICVATVKKVLKHGFLMIGIDGSEAADGSDWFCYHCTAPSIFPVGFCKENGISLSVPKKYKDNFSWDAYLNVTDSSAAPVDYFASDLPDHGFRRGLKLEAVDLMEPRLICVATVTKVIGRLLHVHFDGWENQYDQWVDCRSPDIYPVGWCELVGYELQPPPNMLVVAEPSSSKKKKLKGQSFVTKKKRKKSSAGQKKQNNVTETESQETQNSEQSLEPVADTTAEEMDTDTIDASEDAIKTELSNPDAKQDGEKLDENSQNLDSNSEELNDKTKTVPDVGDQNNDSTGVEQAAEIAVEDVKEQERPDMPHEEVPITVTESASVEENKSAVGPESQLPAESEQKPEAEEQTSAKPVETAEESTGNTDVTTKQDPVEKMDVSATDENADSVPPDQSTENNTEIKNNDSVPDILEKPVIKVEDESKETKENMDVDQPTTGKDVPISTST